MVRSRPTQSPAETPVRPSAEYEVAGMSCDHCVIAVSEEVTQVTGVTSVDVDLAAKRVRVHGARLGDAAVIAAIDEAGYDAVAA
ncbi:MAG TPA: cation transporter [Solirubrobacteraceae bacterium]|nr:cation transporter [Solirubrobacteraceae bacterium]